jgi:hypothetical protein
MDGEECNAQAEEHGALGLSFGDSFLDGEEGLERMWAMGVAGGGGAGEGQGDGGAAAAAGLVCGGAGDDARLMFFGEDGELLGEEEEEEAALRLQACSRADDTGTPSFLKCVRADA